MYFGMFWSLGWYLHLDTVSSWTTEVEELSLKKNTDFYTDHTTFINLSSTQNTFISVKYIFAMHDSSRAK